MNSYGSLSSPCALVKPVITLTTAKEDEEERVEGGNEEFWKKAMLCFSKFWPLF